MFEQLKNSQTMERKESQETGGWSLVLLAIGPLLKLKVTFLVFFYFPLAFFLSIQSVLEHKKAIFFVEGFPLVRFFTFSQVFLTILLVILLAVLVPQLLHKALSR